MEPIEMRWDEAKHAYICQCGDEFPFPPYASQREFDDASAMLRDVVAVHMHNEHPGSD